MPKLLSLDNYDVLELQNFIVFQHLLTYALPEKTWLLWAIKSAYFWFTWTDFMIRSEVLIIPIKCLKHHKYDA